MDDFGGTFKPWGSRGRGRGNFNTPSASFGITSELPTTIIRTIGRGRGRARFHHNNIEAPMPCFNGNPNFSSGIPVPVSDDNANSEEQLKYMCDNDNSKLVLPTAILEGIPTVDSAVRNKNVGSCSRAATFVSPNRLHSMENSQPKKTELEKSTAMVPSKILGHDDSQLTRSHINETVKSKSCEKVYAARSQIPTPFNQLQAEWRQKTLTQMVTKDWEDDYNDECNPKERMEAFFRINKRPKYGSKVELPVARK